MKREGSIILAIVIGLAVLGVAGYVLLPRDITQTASLLNREEGVGNRAAYVVPVNCGGDANCAEANFRTCTPSYWVTPEISFGTAGKAVYYYEIMGTAEGGCSIRSRFIENPDVNIVGKDMVCVYDNNRNFNSAAQVVIDDMDKRNSGKCAGALYELMVR